MVWHTDHDWHPTSVGSLSGTGAAHLGSEMTSGIMGVQLTCVVAGTGELG